MPAFYKICIALIVIGGLNWGLVGLFNFDLVAWICGGATTWVARVIYIVIGIAALCSIPTLFSDPAGPEENHTERA